MNSNYQFQQSLMKIKEEMKLEDQFQQTRRKVNEYLECWKRKWKKEEEERIKAERFARIESDIQFQQTIRKVNEYLKYLERKYK